MNSHQIVEAVLFASDAPLSPDEIARADEMLDRIERYSAGAASDQTRLLTFELSSA